MKTIKFKKPTKIIHCDTAGTCIGVNIANIPGIGASIYTLDIFDVTKVILTIPKDSVRDFCQELLKSVTSFEDAVDEVCSRYMADCGTISYFEWYSALVTLSKNSFFLSAGSIEINDEYLPICESHGRCSVKQLVEMIDSDLYQMGYANEIAEFNSNLNK